MRNALDHLLRTGQRGSCIQIQAFHHLGTDASIGIGFDVGTSQIFGTGCGMGVDIAPTKLSDRASALAAFPRSFPPNPRRPDRPPHPLFLHHTALRLAAAEESLRILYRTLIFYFIFGWQLVFMQLAWLGCHPLTYAAPTIAVCLA